MSESSKEALVCGALVRLPAGLEWALFLIWLQVLPNWVQGCAHGLLGYCPWVVCGFRGLAGLGFVSFRRVCCLRL